MHVPFTATNITHATAAARVLGDPTQLWSPAFATVYRLAVLSAVARLPIGQVYQLAERMDLDTGDPWAHGGTVIPFNRKPARTTW